MSSIDAIIVEDEQDAARNLQHILESLDENVVIRAVLTNIEDTVQWLLTNEAPAIGFFDIELEDGQSFEIFRRLPIKFPVVFTTAFHAYAIKAFKVNSVDYLLKPIEREAVAFSLKKFRSLQRAELPDITLKSILSLVQRQNAITTLLVHYRDKLIPVLLNDFAYFHIENEIVHGCNFKGQRYVIDYTIEQLQGMANDRKFFRANRQYLINRAAIQEMEIFFNGRLLVKLSPSPSDHVIVSKAKLPTFRQWLQQSHLDT